MYLLTVALAIPLGRYIGKVYEGEGTWLDRVLNPLDKIFYKLGGIDPGKEMNWKQHLDGFAYHQSGLVYYFHACINEHELAAAEPGWQSIHDGRPCF